MRSGVRSGVGGSRRTRSTRSPGMRSGARSGVGDWVRGGEIVTVPPSPARRSSEIAPEAILTVALLVLICIGVVMVYSASSATALLSDESPQSLLIRQGIYAVIGLVAFAVCARLRPSKLVGLGKPAVLASIGLLVVVLIPGIGTSVNGSRRWIELGPVQGQPSEFAKLALIVWLAGYLCKNADRLDQMKVLRLPLMATGLMALLIFVEPDLGTTVVLVGAAVAMIALAGVPARIVGIVALGVVILGALGIASAPYRRARFMSFIDPWADPQGAGFQIVQSKLAIGSGGVGGCWPRQWPAKGLLPARGTHRHDHRDGGRGTRAHWPPRGHCVDRRRRLERLPYCVVSLRHPAASACRRAHIAHRDPGDRQPRRGAGHASGDRGAASVHELRGEQPRCLGGIIGDPRGHWQAVPHTAVPHTQRRRERRWACRW